MTYLRQKNRKMDVALFIRVSTTDQAQSDSPEIHEQRGRLYAESQNWNVVKVYKLLGVSGKTTFNHKESVMMREDIMLGRVQGVIISSLSRLARNTSELLEYSSFFEQYGASLISLKENISTNSSSGRFFYTILSSLSTWERENALERMMASLETRRQLGKFTGGNVSYGFSLINAEVVINKEEAPIRAMMYDLFLENRRFSTTAKILNDKGYLSPKGLNWTDSTIKRLLKNPDAKGMRKSNYKTKVSENNPKGIKPSSEWVYITCPSIISEEKWEAVNAIIREQESKSTQTKPLNQRVHLFTGYLFCNKGHLMSNQSKTDKYTCSKCKLRIKKDDLEDIFKTRLEQFIITQEEQKEYISSSNQEISIKKDEIEFVEKAISEVEEKMERLITLNIEGQIPNKGFKNHYDPLFERKEQLSANLKQLKEELNIMYASQNNLPMLLNQSEDLYKKWHTLERHEKRFIVQSVVNRIEFDGKSINFNLKQIAPISSLQLSPNGQHCGTE